jgi:hypothetical protein
VLVDQPPPLTLGLQAACSHGTDGSITATASGGTGALSYSKDGTNFQSSNVFTGLTAGNYTITVKDANKCTKNAPVTVDNCPPCNPITACTPPYPFTSSNPKTSVAFNESEVLRAFQASVVENCTPNQIQVFYNDEHTLTLGVNKITVKTKTGTTTTSCDVTPFPSPAPSPAGTGASAINPNVGLTTSGGNPSTTCSQSDVDVSGRPMYPVIFVTDVTGITNPNDPGNYAGDWQFGGVGIPPHAVFGTWKAAAVTIDQTHTPPVTTVTPGQDTVKNNWNLDGGDPAPAGLKNEGFGAEVRWDVSLLTTTTSDRTPLMRGHTYRLYVMVHDGDQNKTGGDSGQACVFVTVP